MKKETALRQEFENKNGYDVYSWYQDRGMYNPEISGFCQNYVEFLEDKIDCITKKKRQNN
jgi:hypothetical protein